MSIRTPTQLVDEFKKSGEFDRLRRELLRKFQQGDGAATLKEKVEGIARQYIDSEQSLQYMSQERVHRALMQEVDRYPFVERAAADMQVLTDEAFTSAVRGSVQKILREDRGKKVQDDPEERPNEAPRSPPRKGDVDPAPRADSLTKKTDSVDVNQAVRADVPKRSDPEISLSAPPAEPSAPPLIDIVPPSPSMVPAQDFAEPTGAARSPALDSVLDNTETSVDVEMADNLNGTTTAPPAPIQVHQPDAVDGITTPMPSNDAPININDAHDNTRRPPSDATTSPLA